MASAIIHLAVAKELDKKLNIINKYDYYLGSIAPDLAKQIGMSKYESHFLKNSYKDNIPNMELFVSRYPNFMDNAFELGYYIHLYTDKLWFEDCMEKITCNSALRLLDGTKINAGVTYKKFKLLETRGRFLTERRQSFPPTAKAVGFHG